MCTKSALVFLAKKRTEADLLAHGPAGAQMTVYSDFSSYAGGVYRTKCTRSTCTPWGHAVKLVGWGVDTSNASAPLPYWTVANSWCRQWGESGFFRILRGQNEVGIESAVQASLPSPTSLRRATRGHCAAAA